MNAQQIEHLKKLVAALAEWQLCMSYNDSYFSEPAGLVKRTSRELTKLLDLVASQSLVAHTDAEGNAAPAAPVAEPAPSIDAEALEIATSIMALVAMEKPGGDMQTKALIQELVTDLLYEKRAEYVHGVNSALGSDTHMGEPVRNIHGPLMIARIKRYREVFGCTLKEAKEVVEFGRDLNADRTAFIKPPAAQPQPVAEQGVDDIVTALYRRFKDWSKRGFGPDDVTWCEVKADVTALIAASQAAPTVEQIAEVIMFLSANGLLAWRGTGDDEEDAWSEAEEQRFTVSEVIKAVNALRAASQQATLQYTCERHKDEVKKGGACAWCQLEAAKGQQAAEPVASDPRPLFDRKLANLTQRGYEVIGRILHKNGEYALFDSSCRWLTKPQYQRLMHEQDDSLFAKPAAPGDGPIYEAYSKRADPVAHQAALNESLALLPQPVAEHQPDVLAASDEEFARIKHERDALVEGIAEAARKAGIWNGETALTGPHLLMLCNDMAECIAASQQAAEPVARMVKYIQQRGRKGIITAYMPFDTELTNVARIIEDIPLYAAPAIQQPQDDPIRKLIALHAGELDQNDYAYFELARTRRTDWMAWICTNLRDDDQSRKVLATGQGDTPDEACAAAVADYEARAALTKKGIVVHESGLPG